VLTFSGVFVLTPLKLLSGACYTVEFSVHVILALYKPSALGGFKDDKVTLALIQHHKSMNETKATMCVTNSSQRSD